MKEWLNLIVRRSFHSWYWLHENVHRYILDHIRVHGTVRVNIHDLRIKMYSGGDDGIVDALYFSPQKYGEYEEVNVFRVLAQHSKIIFDVGANTGLYSIVSKVSNPSSKVIAFEPYEVNLERLKKNAALNGVLDGIEVVPEALGSNTGKLDFAVPQEEKVCDVLSADIEFTAQFTDTYDAFKTVKVPQSTLDMYVESMSAPGVDLMKIDVENFELEVLEGARQVISTYKPVIMAEMFVDSARKKFFSDYLKPLGYYCYLIGKKGLFRSTELVQNPDCRNYIFSCGKSSSPYLSFTESDRIAAELSVAVSNNRHNIPVHA